MLDESDWADPLADQVAAAGAAWSRPEAWTGSIEGAQMPAAAVGELGLIELMLHGWDVARAGGQSLDVSDELGAELLRCLEPTLEQGRQFEVYGPPVERAGRRRRLHPGARPVRAGPGLASLTGRGGQRSRGGSSKAPHTARQITLLGTPSASACTTVRFARSARLNSVAQTR